MISEEISEMFGYDFSVLKNYINNWNPVDELKWISSYKDRRYIREIKDEEREWFDRGWKELREARPDINISYRDFVDNKIEIDGQKRKLFKYINNKELSELVGKYKLPKTKLYLVISTNFDDFLMCSTDNSWTACTNLKKGDFRYTTIGNIFTNGRFIVYITDMKPKTFRGLESFNMFYRCFGFVNQDGKMVGNIWYPIKSYMAFKDDHFESVSFTKNKVAKYGIDKVYNKFGFFVYPYLDYSIVNKDTGKIEFLNDYFRFYPFVILEDGSSKLYSSLIKFTGNDEENGNNLVDMLWKYCDVCGTWHGNIETIGNYNYCPDCAKKVTIKCDRCAKEIKLLDAHFTEDNEWICDDCKKSIYGREDVKVCNCGTLIKMKGKDQCKYCRSYKVDAFKNPEFEYIKFNQNPTNVYSYFRHAYTPDSRGNCVPPNLRFDDDTFSELEKYIASKPILMGRY